MSIDEVKFFDGASEFGRDFPTSYLVKSGGKWYRMEMESQAALQAMIIVARHQKMINDKGISTDQLQQEALRVDPHADLKARKSKDPLASILLNFEEHWENWRNDRGIQVYEFNYGS